jgi:hypothetical protein
MAGQIVSGPIPDVVTLQRFGDHSSGTADEGGIAIADAPPKARFTARAAGATYVSKSNRITIRHRLGRVVAVIEIVSPGNKGSQNALRAIAEKALVQTRLA